MSQIMFAVQIFLCSSCAWQVSRCGKFYV